MNIAKFLKKHKIKIVIKSSNSSYFGFYDVNKKLIQINTKGSILDTLAHEIAHLICHIEDDNLKHNKIWKNRKKEVLNDLKNF